MAMESRAYALLVANPTLVGQVPAARVFKSGYAGENPVAPYITIQEIGAVALGYIADRPGMDRFRPTVKVYAADEGTCKAIAAIVRDTLEVAGYSVVSDGPEFDEQAKLFVHLSDWHLHESR